MTTLSLADVVAAAPIVSWRYGDAAATVAEAVGATPSLTMYPTVGGNTPQMLVNRVAEMIATGATDVAVVCGAEAYRTRMAAHRRGARPDWDRQDLTIVPGWSDGDSVDILHPAETECGILLPDPGVPPLRTLSATNSDDPPTNTPGRSPSCGPGSSPVASTNPHAWDHVAHDADEIGTVGPDTIVLMVPTVAVAGDLVVDGKVVSNGTGFQFPDGSIQSSAAYARWSHVAIVDLNGDGDYLDPGAAMADLATWCPSPSAAAPCLMKILPGTFSLGSQSLTMQPYVEIEGSGREITVIATSTATAVIAANHSALRSLTVVNETTLAYVIGVSIQNAEFRLSDVRVEVENTNSASYNYGISLSDSTLAAESFDVSVNGGLFATGIETKNACSGQMRLARVRAESPVTGLSRTEGITFSGTSAPAIVESQVSVVGADLAIGIGAYGPDLLVQDVRISVESADNGQGLGHANGGTVEMNGGSIWVDAADNAEALGGYGGLTIARDASMYAKSASDEAHGVYVTNLGEMVLERVTVTAEGATHVWGIYLGINGVAVLTEVIARAFGGTTYNYGIESWSSVPFTVERCTLMASGGGSSWGVLNAGGPGAGAGGTIDHSTITGGNKAIRNDNSSADLFVGNCKLDGGVTSNLTCFGNYDENYAAVTCP